uniref:Zinc finger matrin-type protein 1 n=1 Tax=Phallusia mammillata TaxID=59560 RepID=A0A6F9DXQ6_9ASCI|nr:zinc finger matrin-type protein 1 [Phallusia mammillata]
MTFLKPQYESEENDFTKDFWYTEHGPYGVSGFNLNGKEVGKYCHLCETNLESFDKLITHFPSRKHQVKLKPLRTERTCLVVESSTGNPDDPDNLFLSDLCKVCQAELNTPEQAEAHYMSDRHQKKVRTYFLVKVGVKEMPSKPDTPPDQPQWPENTDNLSREEYCKWCKIIFSSRNVAECHYNGKKHIKKMKEQYSEDSKDKTIWKHCLVCDIRVNSDAQLEIHLDSMKHKNMEEKRRIMMFSSKKIVNENEHCVVVESLDDVAVDQKTKRKMEDNHSSGKKFRLDKQF